MENVRFNISPCTESEVDAYIGKIDRTKYVPNGEVRSTDKSHYDRYSFLADGNRVALVYDTTAKILSVTGRVDYAQTLLDTFAPDGKTVKRSTVPSQGTVPPNQTVKPRRQAFQSAERVRPIESSSENGMRAKLFVSPDRIKRRSDFAPAPTLFVSSKGAVISTDEIYPPQTIKKRAENSYDNVFNGDVIYPPQIAKKRPLPSYGEGGLIRSDESADIKGNYGARSVAAAQEYPQEERVVFNSAQQVRQDIAPERPVNPAKQAGIAISVSGRTPGVMPRKAVISFGTEDDGKPHNADIKINTRTATSAPITSEQQPEKRKRGRPPKAKPAPDMVAQQTVFQQPSADVPQEKRKRGRPPKLRASNDIVQTPVPVQTAPEYKNGYCVKNFPPEALSGAVKRLRADGKTVTTDCTEFVGTPQEVKNYTVSEDGGQKVLLRYATKRMTLQLQGKRSNLFGEVMSQVSHDSDYSSAMENYVTASGDADKKVSDVQNKLKRRLPTAFAYLSEQSRIDFSYGIHDFSQAGLHLSDYSVLLVPAFRGLERFVFDLQTAEGIKVKMIGQAFDKDDSGRYILKSGYTQRIGSVVYAEVLVSLYTEYFSQRNFFAHSDNTDSNVSRSIPERGRALAIFNHLLDVVEYNAKKLKEIGFTM